MVFLQNGISKISFLQLSQEEIRLHKPWHHKLQKTLHNVYCWTKQKYVINTSNVRLLQQSYFEYLIEAKQNFQQTMSSSFKMKLSAYCFLSNFINVLYNYSDMHNVTDADTISL